ncbi:hypothetical protein Ssi03_46370 [Sphaerisporangium siamense]|uniref:Uncharacterized protein n=1 Tax=Sphaerisporangium siamense TaxID=795645 RepID=A0A7W7D333_9ACTN|nr:hypothetical protein [Sphaerisporangium siamense]MBB4699226.1 hypothetical protein [Sphaerisporangium siamense]GII86647.1 hypothetical protein Ssi03_46370 [Sphaerisporangium siamense]
MLLPVHSAIIDAVLSSYYAEVAGGVTLAVAAYVIRRRMSPSGRLRVVTYGGRTSQKYADQFCALYCGLIPEDQQIAPNIILRHAARRGAWRSGRLVRDGGSQATMHPVAYRLYLAVRGGAVVGFLSMLVSRHRNYAFIAYLGAANRADTPPGSVSHSLIEAARRQLGHVLRDPFTTVFEIAPPLSGSGRSRAKARLFVEYARVRGLAVRRAPISYVQPDMEMESLGRATETPADLFVISTPDVISVMSTKDYLRLVESIYYDIYLRTFLDLGIHGGYVSYISDLYERVRSYAEVGPSGSE